MTDILLPECIQLTLDELVCYYHQVRPKFKYKQILSITTSHHRVPITYSTFKSICKREGLNRKKNVTDRELRNIIRNELNTSLSLVGYRQMTECITLKYNVWDSKEDVRKAIKEIDPEGVDRQRRKVIP